MKNHRIDLGGTPFVIRSDVSEERIGRIEALLNERLAEVRGKSSRIPLGDALVPVLFRVADMMMDQQELTDGKRAEALREIATLRQELDDLDGAIAERIATMSSKT